MKYNFFLFLTLACSAVSISQIQFSGSLNFEAYYSTKEELPFWFYSNERGRVLNETNFDVWINGKMDYKIFDESSLEIGGGLFYNDAFRDKIFVDELYANFNHSWAEIIIGRKQEQELYNGLSATNENFAWSLNARPLPGIQIQTSRPLYFNQTKKLGVEFSWEEYLLGDERFLKGARLHSKRFFMIYRFCSNWEVKGGISHYAQWGGESPIYGEQPVAFSDYLKVIAGREGGENAVAGDQINVIGSHLGVYELYLKKEFTNFDLSFIYNHFFEDGSGSRFSNFPDGRYGVFYEREDPKHFFNSIIYEFYYTKDQSQTPPYLFDYYFNNSVYASGWTYQNRVVGVPLLTTNYYDDYIGSSKGIKVGNNSIIAHHIGIAGQLFQVLPYKFLATYRKNYGHYRSLGYDGYEYYPADDQRGMVQLEKNIFSMRMEIKMFLNIIDINFIIGGDFSEKNSNFGVGLNLSKQF